MHIPNQPNGNAEGTEWDGFLIGPTAHWEGLLLISTFGQL